MCSCQKKCHGVSSETINAKRERHCIVRAGVNLNNDDFASESQRETSR
jgi:hypothetical protein